MGKVERAHYEAVVAELPKQLLALLPSTNEDNLWQLTKLNVSVPRWVIHHPDDMLIIAYYVTGTIPKPDREEALRTCLMVYCAAIRHKLFRNHSGPKAAVYGSCLYGYEQGIAASRRITVNKNGVRPDLDLEWYMLSRGEEKKLLNMLPPRDMALEDIIRTRFTRAIADEPERRELYVRILAKALSLIGTLDECERFPSVMNAGAACAIASLMLGNGKYTLALSDIGKLFSVNTTTLRKHARAYFARVKPRQRV